MISFVAGLFVGAILGIAVIAIVSEDGRSN